MRRKYRNKKATRTSRHCGLDSVSSSSKNTLRFTSVASKDTANATQKAKTVRVNDQESFTFIVRSSIVNASAWLIDSGTTSHLANDKSWSIQLNKTVHPVISAVNENMLRTEGIRDCKIQSTNDRGENVSNP